MIFSTAFAEEAKKAAGQPDMWSSMMPFVLIFAIFYFLVIRPQRKAEKKRQEALSKLEPGKLVITNSGIEGKIVSLREKDLDLEIAKNCVVKILRSSISHPKEEPSLAAAQQKK